MSDDWFGSGPRWDWLADAGLAPLELGACITFISGRTREQVLEAFGADTSTSYPLDEAYLPYNVAVLPYGEGWIAIEVNGFEGSRQEVLLELARDGGAAASLYWNDDVGQTWSAVVDGAMATVDVQTPQPEYSFGTPPADVLAALAALHEADEWQDGRPLALELAAQYAGLPLLPAPSPDELVFHPVIPRPETVRVLTDDLGPWTYDAPLLGRRIADAGEFAQRALAEWAATRALQGMDIEADPRVQAVLEQFGRGTAASFEPAQSLFDELYREHALRYRTDASRAGGLSSAYFMAAELRLNAISTLRDACLPDSRTAALEATQRAVFAQAFTEAEMREQASALLDSLSVPPAAGIDPVPRRLGMPDDPDFRQYVADRERALAMVRGLEPEEPEPEPTPDYLPRGPESVPDPETVQAESERLPQLLAAWEEAWEARGAPVDELLAPGLPPDVVRATLEGLPVASTAIAEAWFGWHDGPADPRWTVPGVTHPRMLSIAESLRERERAKAVVRAHEADFPPESYGGAGLFTTWIDSYLPLLAGDGGETAGVDLDSGLVWYGTHPEPGAGAPGMHLLDKPLSRWVAEQLPYLDQPWAEEWRDGAWRGDAGWGVGFAVEVMPGSDVDDLDVRIADLESRAGSGGSFGWISYGPDGPFLENSDPDPDELVQPIDQADAARPDPGRVQSESLRLGMLLLEWEDEWRKRGVPPELLDAGLHPEAVRTAGHVHGLGVDMALAEVWFSWHDGSWDPFTIGPGQLRLLGLREAFEEREAQAEAAFQQRPRRGQQPWIPTLLPLLDNHGQGDYRSTACVDLASAVVWHVHRTPQGVDVVTHGETLCGLVANALAILQADNPRWSDNGWR
jgi:hypothetical protein